VRPSCTAPATCGTQAAGATTDYCARETDRQVGTCASVFANLAARSGFVSTIWTLLSGVFQVQSFSLVLSLFQLSGQPIRRITMLWLLRCCRCGVGVSAAC
jgi:hypothetical protein